VPALPKTQDDDTDEYEIHFNTQFGKEAAAVRRGARF
jgi:hypothetical protein